jgi:hypothetical protein
MSAGKPAAISPESPTYVPAARRHNDGPNQAGAVPRRLPRPGVEFTAMDDRRTRQLIDKAIRVMEDGRDLVSDVTKATELVRRTREQCVAIRDDLWGFR